MAKGDLKVFPNGLFYESDNGQWLPYRIGTYAGGGGKKTIIKNISGGGDTIEDGTFTLSADGSTSTVNGNSSNHTVQFQILAFSGWAINDVITNNTTGATGRVIAITGGVNPRFTLDNLTIGSWDALDQVTNGSVVGNINANAIWVLTIPTTKQLKLWFGLTFNTGNQSIYSDGRSNGIIQNCEGVSVGSDSLNCINVNNTTDGWQGRLVSITSTSYSIRFIKIGVGLDITGQWHAITG